MGANKHIRQAIAIDVANPRDLFPQAIVGGLPIDRKAANATGNR
jgi:hypothetical protein